MAALRRGSRSWPAKASRRWVWLAVVCAAGLCALIAGLHHQQRQRLTDTSAMVSRLGQAANNLANGLLHNALAGPPGSPWQRGQGLALMSQALQDFEQAAAHTGVPLQQRLKFAEQLAQFRALLVQASRSAAPPPAAADLDLRLACSHLAESVRVVDATLRRKVADLSGSLNTLFNLGLAASALLLLSVCLEVLRSERGRARAEEALRAGEARWHSTVAALSEGVLVFDAQGRLQACNKSAEQIMGITHQAMVATPSLQRWQAVDDAGQPLAMTDLPAQRALATGRPLHNQVMGLLRPDGSQVWLNVNAEPLHEKDGGRLIGVVSSISDISERRRDRQDLLRSRTQLTELVDERTRDLRLAVAERLKTETFAQTLLHNLPGLVAYCGRDLKLQFANHGLAEWFGRSPEQAGGQPWPRCWARP